MSKIDWIQFVSLHTASLFVQLLSAQAAPPAKFCQAECFWLGQDAQTLHYGGSLRGIDTDSTRAFGGLQTECSGGLLLKRTLKGVSVTQQVRSFYESQSESRTRLGYRYSVQEQRGRTVQYTILVPQLSAQFETVEATPANSCRDAQESDYPTYPSDAEGNTILGG
jgi:hypothetical protein